MMDKTVRFWRWLAKQLPRKLVYFAALRVVGERVNEDGQVEVQPEIISKMRHWEEYAFYERSIWLHTIREHKKGGEKNEAWRYWRNWLHLWSWEISWSVMLFPRRWSCGATVEFNAYNDEDLQFYLAIPYVFNGWLGFRNFIPRKWLPYVWTKPLTVYNPDGSSEVRPPRKMPVPRQTGFRVFDRALWIDIWRDDMNSGHNWKWNDWIVIRPERILFGSTQHMKKDLFTEDAIVELPEGPYPVTVTIFESTWKRPRWPWPHKMIRAEIDCGEAGIPSHAGKGENSWDLDDDAVFAMTCPESTVEGAVLALRDSILRDRKKYGPPSDLLRERGLVVA
jgi:hypothetical protein